jgi:hypothetical protein
MQEPRRTFEPQVQTTVKQLMEDYKNVKATASKSGKLNSELFKSYHDNASKPYVEGNKFLILYSWGGQTNPVMFNNKLTNEKGEHTCKFEITPLRCIPFC